MKPLELSRTQRRTAEVQSLAAGALTHAEESLESELPPIPSLPRDHPAWRHDLLTLSERAGLFFTAPRLIVAPVQGFWDHAVRMLKLGEHCILIDTSGSYRLQRFQ